MGVQGISIDKLVDTPVIDDVLPQGPAANEVELKPNVDKELSAHILAPEDVKKVATAFAELIGTLNTGVEVRFDEDSGRWVAKVIDRETHQVIKQIPPEELLKIAAKLKDFVGILLDLEV